MRVLFALAPLLLVAGCAAAGQNPGPDSAYQRHAASDHFAHAGESAGHTAHETGQALGHGWQATKQAVGSGWNHLTGNGDEAQR